MLDFVNACLHLDPVAIVEAGGYLGIALIIFAESGLLVGIFLPGDSLLFVAGLLAAAGYLDVALLTTIVVLAAIIGDSVGYWFGAAVGPGLFQREDSRLFKRAYLVRTQEFYSKYGPRTVLLARFVPIVRTLAPVLAGVGSMKYSRFLSYNVIGGALWGIGVTFVGYFLGSIVPNSEKYILPFSLVVIIISFLPLGMNLLRKKKSANG